MSWIFFISTAVKVLVEIWPLISEIIDVLQSRIQNRRLNINQKRKIKIALRRLARDKDIDLFKRNIERAVEND